MRASVKVAATTAALIAISSSPLPAQSDKAEPAFEVASIRPPQGHILRTEPLTVSSALIRMEGYTLFGLVLDAYHLRDYQLAFGAVARPDDIYDVQYDIVARAALERVPCIDETRAMLQTLLADRSD